MTRRLPCRWAHRSFLGFLLLILGTLAASAAGTRRVVILNPYERDVAPFNAAVAAFKSTLARQLGQPVDIYEIPLNLARMSEAGGEDALVAYLAGVIKGHPVDLVVSIGAAGMQFAAGNREFLFPETPYLVLAGDPRFAPPGFLESNTTLITQSIDLQGIIEDILQLKPETDHIAVVFGSSTLERTWVNICRREFEPYADRLDFTWLNDLTLDEVLEQCAVLPPDSFILHGLFVVDAAGVPCEHSEVLRRLHDVANAPVFAYFQSEFGLGSIGGRLYRDEDVGAEGARTAVRILRGEDAGSIPPQMLEATDPTFDWRELQRWGVSEASLPSGSVVAYRELGFWTHYRWLIIGVAVFLVLQAALIAGLLVNRARRLQGEAEAALIAEISSKFVNIPASAVDREIEDAQRRLCQFLNLDFSTLWQWSDESPGFFKLTHFYTAQEGLLSFDRMNQDDYPWSGQQLLAGRIIRIESVDEAPEEAARDADTLRLFGIKSNLALPLSMGGETPFGVLGLGTMQQKRKWSDVLVNRLQLIAQIFAGALARKRAEEAMRESEERMTMAADAAELGVWVWSVASNQIWGSDRWLSLFGLESLDGTTFESVIERIHPADRELVERGVRGAMTGRKDYAGEFRVVLPDGTERWIASRGRMHLEAEGRPTRMLGTAIDITERRQAEQKVRQLSLAVEQSPVSVVITDPRGTITYVNPKFSEISGYSPADCIGRNTSILSTGEASSAYYEEMWTCITGGGTWRGELRNRKKNGELFWEWEVISPMLDAGGNVTHFVAVKEDITERKRTEEAFRASEARLAVGADLAGLGYYEVDHAESSGFADDRFHDICDIPSGQQEGLQSLDFWMEHLHPDDRERVLGERQRLHDGSIDRISTEYRYVHPTRGVKWLHHLARVSARDESGQAVRTFGVVRDITLEKRAEMDIEELRGNLTHLARVNSLGALSGSLAHELNQPLGIILSNAQAAEELLLQDSIDLEELKDILSDIVAADHRASDVILRLRALLKRGQLTLLPLELNSVIEEVLKLTRADLVGRGVTVAFEMTPNLPLVAGDRVQLQQVLLNLILNAAEAMAAKPPGDRRLHLQTQLIEDRVRVTVRDEGGGLPAEIENLFEPFYTTKSQGLGMGLAICRTIVTAHHGLIWAEPNPASGAVFQIELPVVEPLEKT